MQIFSEIPLLAPARQLVDRTALPAAAANLATRLPRSESTVIINDPQRHTDTAAVLTAVGFIGLAGPLRVLVACGTHRFSDATRAEFQRRLAAAIPQSILDFSWHDCRAADLASCETPGNGCHCDASVAVLTPRDCGSRTAAEASRWHPSGWRCHPWLLDSETPLLAIGSVEPHYFAGLTGAHKTATIGCAAHQDIQANHAGALSDASRPFALEGNPIYDGVAAMLAALQARRPVLAVNVLQVGAEILTAAAGDPLAAVHALARAAREVFSRTIDQLADALILDVTGPLACSFYQAEKAIKNNENAVRDGGLLVLCAPCPEGVGQDHFVSLLRQADTYAAAVAYVAAHGYRLGDHKAVKLRRLTDPAQRGVHVAAVSEGLSADACQTLGLHKAASVEAALAEAGLSPSRHRIYRVADAANTVVMVR